MLEAQDFDEADEHKRVSLADRTSIATVITTATYSMQ